MCTKMFIIAVPAKTMLGSNAVLPELFDVFLNHVLQVLYGYKKKYCLKFRVRRQNKKYSL